MSLHKWHIPGENTSKYGARKTEVDGILFDSVAEADRYSQLKLLEYNGDIKDLVLQPAYPLIVNELKIGVYKADFVYRDCKTNQVVVEDCKGFRTREFIMKRKLMQALYGITILETGGKR